MTNALFNMKCEREIKDVEIEIEGLEDHLVNVKVPIFFP